jgi:anaphase-promoting complex subunit 3
MQGNIHNSDMAVDKHSETTRQAHPDAAAVWCLLGKLWQGHKDIRKAVDCYVESLKHNPFMWDAFTGLCETGMLRNDS